MEKIPSSCFVFKKYNLVGIPNKVYMDTDMFVSWLQHTFIIGYCVSMDCEIRPKNDSVAVMFYDDTDDVNWWCHVPCFVWDKFLLTIK